MEYTLVLIGLCVQFSIFLCSQNFNAYWERAEPIYGKKDTLIDYSNFRVIRKGPNRYLNGTFKFKVDFDNTYSCKAAMAVSPQGNSQFIRQPYQVETGSFCEFFKTAYRKYGQPMFENKTNFPMIPPEGICPLPKGEFYTKEADLAYDTFPWVVATGLWKVEFLVFDASKELVGGYRVFLKIESKV